MSRIFDDNADRTNSVKRYDGHAIWVAPSSLVSHGLKNGQTLSRAEWDKLGITLAREWIDYVVATRTPRD